MIINREIKKYNNYQPVSYTDVFVLEYIKQETYVGKQGSDDWDTAVLLDAT